MVADHQTNCKRALSIWRLSVNQYHQMMDAEILYSGDPVELLEGLLVEKHCDDPSKFIAVDGELPALPIWRLTVAEFHIMLATGIIQGDDPVELLEGVLVKKAPRNPACRVSTSKVRNAIERALPPGWHVATREPIITDDSQPEPDVSVIRGKVEDYRERHPGPLDVAAIVELVDECWARDAGDMKRRLCARSKIPDYWIVNLAQRQIEVYTDPTGPADLPDYRQRQDYGETDSVALIIEGREVASLIVGDLLP